MLPNWIGIGPPRAGTTTLWEILRHHPDIYLPVSKETHFFGIKESVSVVGRRGITFPGLNASEKARYEINFFSSYKGQKSIGEITPGYIYYDMAPVEIARLLGDNVKFLVTLRHPVKRAYSQYMFNVRNLLETSSFEETMTAESSARRSIDVNYLYSSLYANHINEYFRLFPKENFFFTVFETDICQNIEKTIRKILTFLEVDHSLSFNPKLKLNRTLLPQINYFEKEGKAEISKPDTGETYSYDVLPDTIVFLTGWPDWDKIINHPSENCKKTLLRIKNNLKKELDPDLEANLMKKFFVGNIKTLEDLIKVDLSIWYANLM